MTIRLIALLVLILCCSTSRAEETVQIPLDQIWALKMPGTKDAYKLEPRHDQDMRNTVTSKIQRSLVYRTSERAKAGPCFLVTGEGKEALLNAAKVIVDRALPAKALPTNKELSLVFYSYSAPGYVHLQSASRTGSQVTVKYQIVTHRSADSSVHFALIPLGQLSAGQYKLETLEVPSDTPYQKHGRTERAACDSCTVTIQDKLAEKLVPKM